MESILDKYLNKYKKIKSDSDFYFGEAQSFVSQLLSLPPEKRYKLINLFEQIENDAFEAGIEIPNLNVSQIIEEKIIWEKEIKKKHKKKKTLPQSNFNDVLFNFSMKYHHFFNRIKGYYLFKLENNDNRKTDVLILYDEDFEKHPEMNVFDSKDSNYKIFKYLISDFNSRIVKNKEILNKNYLTVILLTPKLSNNKHISEVINIIDQFDNHDFISIVNMPINSISDYHIMEYKDGIEIIENYSSKIFNNRSLSYEEEKILKKLFEGEGILDYKFLKSGNSGSKVIEIQPLRVNSPTPARFVIKFSRKDSDRKIKAERKKFRESIMDVGIISYSHDYDETKTHEAIKYNYASSDSKSDSFPFSELISKKLNNKFDYDFTLGKVIDELFECEPYKIWDSRINKETQLVSTLYKDYVKSDEKIFEVVSKIKGKERYVKEEDVLFINFKKIKNISLESNRKICHGDLHSENFFKDNKGVYLIDFGWTSRHHALIDHSTLECSLKYKHIPFYVPIEELIEYEKQLLNIDSFSKSYDLSFIKRPEVLEIFKLIIHLREKAVNFLLNNTSPIEYLISMFMISMRQIQYSDLNQRYALENSVLLSQKILELHE